MVPAEKKEKHPIKVYVRMHDGSRMLGNVFLAEDERLQDIMNDERMFIPIHVEEQKAVSLAMLSKRYIQQIEEVVSDSVRDEEFYSRYDRRTSDRAGADATGGSLSGLSGLNLELDEKPFGRRKDDSGRER